MDPSSETTYAKFGIGVSESYPAQFLSSHALLQEQSSQDGSRRMLFPLKTDNFIKKKKQHIVDRWRDAVSPGSPPFASDDVDLFPFDISLDFPFRGAYRGLNVPGA